MSDEKVDNIIQAVDQLASNPNQHSGSYQVDEPNARFALRAEFKQTSVALLV